MKLPGKELKFIGKKAMKLNISELTFDNENLDKKKEENDVQKIKTGGKKGLLIKETERLTD